MTEETTPRRRAPGMSPEQRREMITAAALPLIAEYGAAVTTSKIARAAGIGEATIFRVFTDKEELLAACLAEAVRPDHAVREIASISLDDPLDARLTQTAEALEAHLTQMGTVAGALHTSGHLRNRQAGPANRPAPNSREQSIAAIREAVADLFEPDQQSLRLAADQTAAIFLGLLFMRPRQGDLSELPVTDLIQVFLHGALN